MPKKNKGLARRKSSLNRFLKKLVMWAFLLIVASFSIFLAFVFLIAQILS